MSEAAEADPVVICVGSDHFRAHTGAAWRAVADGAIVRVSDRRSGEVLGWLLRRTPHGPLDTNGRPLAGAALRVHLMKQAELDAAAAAREDIEALARVVCRMAARGLMMPAPDALAVLGAQGGPGGREDALRCLRAAGYPPEPQAQRWAKEAPLRQQSGTVAGSLYAEDPSHDPRVTEALLAGASMAEVADLVAEVRAERQQAQQDARAAAAAAGHDPGVLWVTREGGVVRDGGAVTPLVPQRSVVRKDVPELGSEPVPPPPPFTWGA